MEKSICLDHLTLGTCYYPEHWDESLHESDLARMRDHGIEVIRIAEFAWSKFEPEEGQFTFAYFDRFLDLAHKHGMKVIMGTPTATPPAWLTERYPEVLNADCSGTLFRHGMRRHYNYNSPVYQRFCERIVEKIAAHYCPHPAVIGWQIDNELNCEIASFYSQSDHIAFRAWLHKKFGTLDALNEAIGAAFWNQQYTDWAQVYLRRPTVNGLTNPHMSLLEKQFISHSAISFCALQADILKKYRREGQFITTNGIFGHLDSHEMTQKHLDFITYDSYPNFAYELSAAQDGLRDRRWSRNLTLARSISPNFGIMEQQSGAGGWVNRMHQCMPAPGQMRLWTMQSIAHGADFVSYFRWRTCGFGTEIYWHGILDYDNRDNRRLAELSRIHEDVKKLSAVCQKRNCANVLLLRDYLNDWDGEDDIWTGGLRRGSEEAWFEAAQRLHTPIDISYVQAKPDLSSYALVVCPHATILKEETAAWLEDYVRSGGTLLLGARTGYKDEFGRCPMRPMPGPAAELTGALVKEYTPVRGAAAVFWDGEALPAQDFADILEPTDAKVLATYESGWYKGAPALCEKTLGKGKTLYFGGGFSVQTAQTFLKKLGLHAPYADRITLDPDTEITVRGSIAFILNYADHAVRVTLHKTFLDLLSDQMRSGDVEIPAYDVLILRL